MADQTSVGAKERSRSTSDVDDGETPAAADGASESTEADAAASNGETTVRTNGSVATEQPPATAGSVPAVEPEPSPKEARTEAAERHPSMAQRLGMRPRGQLRARKVQRIVRRVDPWSVLKLSLVFYFCVWVMVIVAVVLLWGVAVGSGSVASIENFIAEFLAFEEFHFNGDQLFQIFALGGLIGVFVATAVTAVLSVLFNLIADLTGGIRLTVVQEETARRILDRR
jgi:hypothetical protein